MKLCILIPAYNCAHVITEVIQRIQLPGADDEIIVVDDGSGDDTLGVAQKLPRVFAARNPVNRGYGGTSQRLYELAVERGADITVNIHGDLGHPPENIPLVLDKLTTGQYDVVLGSRLRYLIDLSRREGWTKLLSAQARNDMPLTRVLGHLALTSLQNFCFRTNLYSFHEGMRGCTRKVVDWIVAREFATWYNYDTELILHMHRQGFRIGEVAVPPFYTSDPKTAAPSFRYGIRVAGFALRTLIRGYQPPKMHESSQGTVPAKRS